MKKVIKIELDDDTAEFLALARADGGNREVLSAYINSLLRQERFRQGYPATTDPEAELKPARTWVEPFMLRRSGLLPFSYARRRPL